MAQSPKRKSNGNGSSADPTRGSRTELQLKDRIVEGAGGNSLLETVNLGQGNYREDDYWQQIRAYRRGLFLHTAFQNILTKRAIHETKVALGREGYNTSYHDIEGEVETYDAVDLDNLSQKDSRRKAILEHGERIWKRLGHPDQNFTEKQLAAVLEKTGVDTNWLPISWQMVLGRHEASRSRNAELIRDVFSDMKHVRTDDANAEDVNSLLGGK